MPVQHTKPFGIYHWDTFDNETILIGEVNSLPEANEFVEKRYENRIESSGADQVDIVDYKGNVVKKFSVG